MLLRRGPRQVYRVYAEDDLLRDGAVPEDDSWLEDYWEEPEPSHPGASADTPSSTLAAPIAPAGSDAPARSDASTGSAAPTWPDAPQAPRLSLGGRCAALAALAAAALIVGVVLVSGLRPLLAGGGRGSRLTAVMPRTPGVSREPSSGISPVAPSSSGSGHARRRGSLPSRGPHRAHGTPDAGRRGILAPVAGRSAIAQTGARTQRMTTVPAGPGAYTAAVRPARLEFGFER
jgi:hypothetical protein